MRPGARAPDPGLPRVAARSTRWSAIALAGQPGTVATYTVDPWPYSLCPPMIDTVVDFDGGGRFTVELTDADPDEVEIGKRVEMTFRRLYTTVGRAQLFLEGEAAFMASNGIRDRVAIVGMGCTTFGEHWDRSADDLLIDATQECFASTPAIALDDVDAFWLGTMSSGQSGSCSSTAAARLQTGDAGRELLRDGSGRSGTPATRSQAGPTTRHGGRVEKLKDTGYSGLVRSSPPATARRRRPR